MLGFIRTVYCFPDPFMGKFVRKKLFLMKHVGNDLLLHSFDKNRDKIHFLHLFCVPRSESWLGRTAFLGDGEMRCRCCANESNLVACSSHVRLVGLLHSHFSSRSPRSPSAALRGNSCREWQSWSHVVAVDQAPGLIPAIGHICKY